MMEVDVGRLLRDPEAGVSLDDLKVDLNQLAKLRNDVRLAFCKRLAIVYLLIVGNVPGRASVRDGKIKAFYAWCNQHLQTAGGKSYAPRTLRHYLEFGFANNPKAKIEAWRTNRDKNHNHQRSMGAAVRDAIKAPAPLLPIRQLKPKYELPTNVAHEVNALMTAWEAASSQARGQFIYMVTGKRVAA